MECALGMSKWFWGTYLAAAAVLLIFGIPMIIAAAIYGSTAAGTSNEGGAWVYILIGAVLTCVGVYWVWKAQTLYGRRQTGETTPPAHPQKSS